MNCKLHRLTTMLLLAAGMASTAMAEPPADAQTTLTATDPGIAAAAATPELLGAVPAAVPSASPASEARSAASAPSSAARPSAAPASVAARSGNKTAEKKSAPAAPHADIPMGLGFDGGATENGDSSNSGDSEQVVFQRTPVRIVLSVNRERLITFPGPIAFHAPEGFETLVRSQIIDRTAYLSAIAPFGSLRIVAEDLSTGRYIPIDLVGDIKTNGALRPVEVMVPGQGSTRVDAVDNEAVSVSNEARAGALSDPPALDMVGLTRYAAQALYAPRRLVPAIPGVKQLPIASVPVEGIYRGWRVQTTPIGAWRSGQLYVTALRFTNQGSQPTDIDLQEMRGRWLAATAQHSRLLAAGSDWDTTTVYLVCDRPFDACR